MKKQKKASSGKGDKRAYGAGLTWVANNLTEKELKHADERGITPESIMEFLLNAVDYGIDIKVGYDAYSEAYQITAVGAYKDTPSAGFAVSARSGRDVFDALVLICYKVEVMAEFDLSTLPSEKDLDDLRG